MPKELSIKPEPYQHRWTPGDATKRSTPAGPIRRRTTTKWAELVFQWMKHCVEQYGRAEVETWYWQVWNEPNIGYWRGTPEEFRKLHDYAIDAVRRALPTAKVGGPDTAGGGRFMRDFLEHCLRGTNHATGKTGTPLDFVSFHAKGAPTLRRRPRADGHRQPTARRSTDGFRIIASLPGTQGQADRHRRIRPGRLRRLSQGPQNRLSQRHDVFQLHGRELCPQARPGGQARREPRRRVDVGLRVRRPALLRRLSLAGDATASTSRCSTSSACSSKMSGQRLAVESDGAVPLDAMLKSGVRDKPDVAALASLDRNKLCVLVWHYHDDDVPGRRRTSSCRVTGLPAGARERAAALPHRRRSQQRLHRLEADGLAATAHAGAIRSARKSRSACNGGSTSSHHCERWPIYAAACAATPSHLADLSGMVVPVRTNRFPCPTASVQQGSP